MEFVRTPDTQFDSLDKYPFPPNYHEVQSGDGASLRMHYLDVAPLAPHRSGNGTTIVLMHGEPSWSFLYRHMIPILTAAGHRCIAPDLIGFGRSDKPVDTEAYSYASHAEWVRELLFDHLDLNGFTIFGQDWGGLLALRLVGEHPERFARVAIGNSALPTGDERVPDAFQAWQDFARDTPVFDTGSIVDMGCTTALSPEVIAGYNAPFTDERSKAGARVFPTLVPTTSDDPASDANRAAWTVLEKFDKPFLTAFSDEDPIFAGLDIPLRNRIPGAVGQPHVTIAGGGHFHQEDCGPAIAEALMIFIDES